MDFSILGKEPISSNKPAGEDARYDALFDQLQREVDRASQPSLAGGVDWESVIEVAGDILCRKSKDLLAAAYLAVGLIHTRGIDGLDLGLTILGDLLQHHGPALFPLRDRARLRAVEWWSEKCEAALKPLENSSLSPEQWAAMEEKLAKVGLLLNDLLPEAPSLQWLGNFLQRAEQSALVKQAPQAPFQARAATVCAAQVTDRDDLPTPLPEPAAPLPETSGSVGSQAENSGRDDSRGQSGTDLVIASSAPPARNRVTVEEALRKLRESAEAVRNEDITASLAYRLSRQAAWLEVSELPPAAGNRTLVPAPPANLRNRLASLQSCADRGQSINELEAQLGQFIFWLDLNRLTAKALQELGAQQAAAAVRQETVFLLQRLPGLEQLTFVDGTSFADAETREWLAAGRRRERLRPAGNSMGTEVADPLPAPAEGSFGAIETEAVAALAGEGELVEKIADIQRRLQRSGSVREQFQWRLSLSKELMHQGLQCVATPHLQRILSDIERFRLEEWDPVAALTGLKLVRHGFEADDDAGIREKAREVRDRIAILDAAELVGKAT
ncbi:MAG TPA: type VI secretion system protein TssA [Geomonas sp.]|nr:type VI secretion system protein TssA [Geomonas sp.]